jgi:fructosamine-3-kinase
MTTLAETGAHLLGGVLDRSNPIGGGDLSQVVRLHLADGRTAIVKGAPAPGVEAAMLKAIAETGAPAPKVLAFSDEARVIETGAADGPLAKAWHNLGKVLAKLHASQGPSYGWTEDYAFGPVAISNGSTTSWPQFWAERRLICHCAYVAATLARRIEALAADLANRLPKEPLKSLLHGNLWGGNILTANGQVTALIDPACYYGHAEVDLAMLTLFDHPTAAFYETYGELEPGYDERHAIYQLWPALVHLRLFGSGYRALVERLLAKAGV